MSLDPTSSEATTITATNTISPTVSEQSQTYWESLCGKDRRESVNERFSRTLGNKTAWGCAGVLQQKWNEEVYPAISLIINSPQNYEKIFRKVNTRVTRPCSLYMVGESPKHPDDKPWERAQPTIVTMSSKLKVAQKLCSLLQESTSLKNLNLGFSFMFFEDKKLVLTAGKGNRGKKLNHDQSLCGHPIWTPVWYRPLHSKYRQATIGGVVMINSMPFILTAAHIFYTNDSDSDDYDGSTLPNTFTGVWSMDRALSADAGEKSLRSHSHILDRLSLNEISVFQARYNGEDHQTARCSSDGSCPDELRRFGYLNRPSLEWNPRTIISPDLDWALIYPKSPEMCKPNTVRTPAGNILCLDSISPKPPTGSVVVIAGSSGVFETQASGQIEGMILPGSMRMQEVWTIDSSCQPGDCGSWVVDAQHGSVYGMIVATAAEAEESFLVPAKHIFDDIKAKWPASTDIRLPTSSSSPGEEDIATQMSCYKKAGQWKEAEELGSRIAHKRRRMLGPEHPDTLKSVSNLAQLYETQGLFDKAVALETHVIQRNVKVFGQEHLDTLASMSNLAQTYKTQERFQEAELYGKRVLEIQTNVLGQEHPATLASMDNLARIYECQGRLEQVRILETEVVKIRTRVLGLEHPDTLASMRHLARIYEGKGWWEKAEKVQVEVLDIRKRLFGHDHPDTLTHMRGLARIYEAQGRWTEAEELEMQIIEARERALGQDHPDTIRSKRNLVRIYQSQGRWEEVEIIMKEIKKIEEDKKVKGLPLTIKDFNPSGP